MKVFDRFSAWRHRRAHAAFLRERARRRALEAEDAQKAIRDMAQNSSAQQGTYRTI
jgi:hypothetical protein